MGITFTNNWKNISDKLRSTFRTEFKGALPVYINDENVSTGGQYLQLDLAGTELSEKMLGCEIREYTVNFNYIFQSPNTKKSSLDHVLRYTSRIEQLMQNNISLSLTDSTTAVNCRVESTTLEEGIDNSYLVSFDWKCQHLSGLSEVINTTRVIPNTYSLDFDGTDDYVAINSTFSYTNHTISAWVKPVADRDIRDADNDGIRIKSFTDEKIIYELNTSDLTSTSAYSGSWIHIVASYDGTTQKLYINGKLDQSTATSQTISVSANAKISARNFGVTANNFNGNIDEVAVWDTALDGDAVKVLYNLGNPTDLTINNGAYDEYTDNLKGYWRMGDGTLDAYPLIADQVNPTLGSDLFDADVYATGTGSWTAYSSNTVENDDGAIKITYVNSSNGAYIYFRDAHDLSSDLTVGKLYKLKFDVKTNSGSSVGVQVYNGSSAEWVDQTITNTDFETKTHYFTSESTNGAYIRPQSMGSGEIIWIKDITLQEVQGNAGLMTNMVSGDIEEDTP